MADPSPAWIAACSSGAPCRASPGQESRPIMPTLRRHITLSLVALTLAAAALFSGGQAWAQG